MTEEKHNTTGEELKGGDKQSKLISLRREELESLLIKRKWRPEALAAINWTIACSLVALAPLLAIAFLPEPIFDGLIHRLQSSGALQLRRLELVALKESWSGNVFSVEGLVRNAYSEGISGVEAVVRLYSEAGLVDTVFVPLKDEALQPGMQSNFRFSYVHDGQLKYYELFFRQKDGSFVAHKDIRKISSALSYVKKQPL